LTKTAKSNFGQFFHKVIWSPLAWFQPKKEIDFRPSFDANLGATKIDGFVKSCTTPGGPML
jgi:hypothetical protein